MRKSKERIHGAGKSHKDLPRQTGETEGPSHGVGEIEGSHVEHGAIGLPCGIETTSLVLTWT